MIRDGVVEARIVDACAPRPAEWVTELNTLAELETRLARDVSVGAISPATAQAELERARRWHTDRIRQAAADRRAAELRRRELEQADEQASPHYTLDARTGAMWQHVTREQILKRITELEHIDDSRHDTLTQQQSAELEHLYDLRDDLDDDLDDDPDDDLDPDYGDLDDDCDDGNEQWNG